MPPVVQVAAIPVLEYVLQNGANVDATDLHGRTSLHYAAIFDHLEAAQLLLKHRATRWAVYCVASRQAEAGGSSPRRQAADVHAITHLLKRADVGPYQAELMTVYSWVLTNSTNQNTDDPTTKHPCFVVSTLPPN